MRRSARVLRPAGRGRGRGVGADELPGGRLPEVVAFGHISDPHPLALVASTNRHEEVHAANALTALALTAGSASLERTAAGTAIDAGGLVPDVAPDNSWTNRVHEVDPLELLEVQLCNVTAPFILVSRLRPSMAASPARRKYVVNVSAMEGQFGRGYKGAGHPHTNMAKAALNMLTRTSAADLFADGILMTSVDTGWITDERPHPTKARLADEGFHAPLDLVDGAARVYDPIVRGERGRGPLRLLPQGLRPSRLVASQSVSDLSAPTDTTGASLSRSGSRRRPGSRDRSWSGSSRSRARPRRRAPTTAHAPHP